MAKKKGNTKGNKGGKKTSTGYKTMPSEGSKMSTKVGNTFKKGGSFKKGGMC